MIKIFFNLTNCFTVNYTKKHNKHTQQHIQQGKKQENETI